MAHKYLNNQLFYMSERKEIIFKKQFQVQNSYHVIINVYDDFSITAVELTDGDLYKHDRPINSAILDLLKEEHETKNSMGFEKVYDDIHLCLATHSMCLCLLCHTSLKLIKTKEDIIDEMKDLQQKLAIMQDELDLFNYTDWKEK